MKKIISFFLVYIISGNIFSVYADENKATTKLSSYELYELRVASICNQYRPKKMILSSLTYDNLELGAIGNDLNIAKNRYKNHMNELYKCALIDSQKKGYQLVIEDLTKYSPELSKKIKPKFKSIITKLELSQKSLKCIGSDDKNSLQKLRVLQQTTYELCKYNSYLEYLKIQNQSINHLLGDRQKMLSLMEIKEQSEGLSDYEKEMKQHIVNSATGSAIAISEISKLSKQKQNAIQDEIERVYKIFPIAFQAYSEFENNFTIHVLLELLKDDFYTYRKNLHKVINPINQVVYKISNAMKLK